MKLITLGTGSPLPDPNRAGPSTLVRTPSGDFLFDCGRGVLMRSAAVGAGPLSFHTVLLTHLHSDHITDFNDVVTMRWAMSATERPLRVVGPTGTARMVRRTLAMLEDDIGYRLAHHDDLNWSPSCEVEEVSDGVVFDDGTTSITAVPTDHAPVSPTIGYRLRCQGRSIVVAGDTVPCKGLDRLAAGADVYVQTVVHRALVEAIPAPRLQDILDYHSSIADAATTAVRAGVSTLVLTHLVPPPAPGSEDAWADEARAIFDGEIVVATDLWERDL
ncbi:MAG: MBL fold metallo-hydrolase [Acidimicrobiales bacterium]